MKYTLKSVAVLCHIAVNYICNMYDDVWLCEQFLH